MFDLLIRIVEKAERGLGELRSWLTALKWAWRARSVLLRIALAGAKLGQPIQEVKWNLAIGMRRLALERNDAEMFNFTTSMIRNLEAEAE